MYLLDISYPNSYIIIKKVFNNLICVVIFYALALFVFGCWFSYMHCKNAFCNVG